MSRTGFRLLDSLPHSSCFRCFRLLYFQALDPLEAIVQQQHSEMDSAFEQATFLREFPAAALARVQR